MTTYKLETEAEEKGTYVINVSFKDEDGEDIAPKSLTWTLTDMKNRVINNRESVSIASPSSSNDIVLSNNDLALSQNDNRRRLLTIYATYDSVAYGNDLPIIADAEFKIENKLRIN